jgi:hypothetical protein
MELLIDMACFVELVLTGFSGANFAASFGSELWQ